MVMMMMICSAIGSVQFSCIYHQVMCDLKFFVVVYMNFNFCGKFILGDLLYRFRLGLKDLLFVLNSLAESLLSFFLCFESLKHIAVSQLLMFSFILLLQSFLFNADILHYFSSSLTRFHFQQLTLNNTLSTLRLELRHLCQIIIVYLICTLL